MSAAVAACSVTATAWLASQTTSGAIRQQQGRDLTADARIYNTLLGYAAAHPRWDDVQQTVRNLAEQSERRIVLTTQSRQLIADSTEQSTPPLLPPQASAVVDPLSVDTALTEASTGTANRIDPRAVGPFLLPTTEQKTLREAADDNVACLNRIGIAADIVRTASGRPRVQLVGSQTTTPQETRCHTGELDRPTTTEQQALDALNQLVNACLDRQDRPGVRLNLDLSWPRAGTDGYDDGPTEAPVAAERVPTLAPQPVPSYAAEPAAPDSEADRAAASCVDSARREQLGTYVASPALLFITDPGGTPATPAYDLTPANTARIAGVAAAVLALTVGASLLAGARLVRPLHALTGAAQRMRDGEEPETVPVAEDNEIGRLAAAFNDMTAHRARLEDQRKAMVSDVAHELRTPLSNIRGWLEAAQDGLATPDPAFVASLLDEAVQLQHIIDDLQDLAAADAGALRLHHEPVRIDELLTQVAAAHQAGADTAGVTLEVIAGAPVPLTADPVRLRQAVGNLVSNAVRHTPTGGRVTLSAYADGQETAIDVTDTGSGIAATDLPHVFDRFWRAEKSRNRRTGGSGLGLAIVRKLTEAHGGTVNATSTEGQGSVFTLRLPTKDHNKLTAP
ncbi:HAMP domain-containing sensor histidine kinase [Streptomyces sp. CRN 30]|uniref:sensor histidine kinase n=1 Tax=Streptomyces sp. CRN 30 TaxID=3075613 RepID=UPI002A80AD53|nr:HAMP domain-containing sensor histidine kinase [Streptomyces sp. CRN 30]